MVQNNANTARESGLENFCTRLNAEVEKVFASNSADFDAAQIAGLLPGLGSLAGQGSILLTMEKIKKDVKAIISDEKKIYEIINLSYKENNTDILSEEINNQLNKLADMAQAYQGMNDLIENYSMGEFSDKIKKSKEGDAQKPLSEASIVSASERFARFLEKQGFEELEAQRVGALHDKFVKEELPELSALAAVQELRDHFNPRPIEPKPKYQGKTIEEESPEEFLMHHYKDDIQAGRLTTGVLQTLDSTLYVTLSREFKSSNRDLADIVEPHGKPYPRKAAACAAILGISSREEAGRFFSGIRADRLSKHEAKNLRG